MKAMTKGYSFDWIEGEMYEKSPFTLVDFIQQRKRWLQGVILVVHSRLIPLKAKIFLTLSTYSCCLTPLSTLHLFLAFLYPTQCPIIIDLLCAFQGGVTMYMCVFGTLKSFSLFRFGILKTILALIVTFLTIPFKIALENSATVLGLFTNKHRFYVVKKTTDKNKETIHI